MALLSIIIATLLVSLVSFVGLALVGKHIHRALHYLISFSAAVLISAALFDLLPHALHEMEEFGVDAHQGLLFVVVGIVLFYLIETFIHWHHCGTEKECKRKPAGQLILVGDFVHNFIDGILITSAFLLDTATGIIATITVVLHEIPQEIGDFSILLHSGYTRWKALKLNFFSGLSAVLGGLLGYFALSSMEQVTPFAVAVTAGGFLYIALSDIMPHLHEHKQKSMKIQETIIFLGTIIIFWYLLGMMH